MVLRVLENQPHPAAHLFFIEAFFVNVFSIQQKGQAPLEYCRNSIRDNILSERKRELLKNLEQDLLKNAQEKKDFVIYKNED